MRPVTARIRRAAIGEADRSADVHTTRGFATLS